MKWTGQTKSTGWSTAWVTVLLLFPLVLVPISPASAESVWIEKGSPNSVTLAPWQSVNAIPRVGYRGSSPRQHRAMKSTIRIASAKIYKEGITYPVGTGTTVRAAWGSGTYQVFVRVRYAKKYRLHRVWGDVDKWKDVQVRVDCWTKQPRDYTKSVDMIIACSNSNGESFEYDFSYYLTDAQIKYWGLTTERLRDVAGDPWVPPGQSMRSFATVGTRSVHYTAREVVSTRVRYFDWQRRTLLRTIDVTVKR